MLFNSKCHTYIVVATQKQVGYAWIQYKLEKDFTTASDAQKSFLDTSTPVVIGPGPAYYIVDDHHTLCALDYSGHEDVVVTLNILCDKRDMNESDFWQDLSKQNLANLVAHPEDEPNSLPIAIDYSDLSSEFSFTSKSQLLSDDPWRSLAGFSRKVSQPSSKEAPQCDSEQGDSEYCERCMYRGCGDGYQSSGGGVAFFEFRWSYFMNEATYYDSSYWPTVDEYQSFKSAYSQLSVSDNGSSSGGMDNIDVEEWQAVAASVVALCRSDATKVYKVPTDLYPGSSSTVLPGYYNGYVKLADDPACSAPVCSM